MENYNINSTNNNNTETNNNFNMNDHTAYSSYSRYATEDNEYKPYTYPAFESGFESGNPVIADMQCVKTLMTEEVIAKSFIFMCAALLITALAAFTTSIETAIYLLTGSRFYILLGVELAIVFASNYVIGKNMPLAAGVLYAVYSYLNGVTLSIIFMAYTTASVTAIFLVTAGLFGIMAVYGLVTKKDLSSIGNICMMGLVGIIITGLVNIFFLRSSMADTVICAIGVLIFVGLTAYDTQKIKERVAIATDETVMTLALYGGFQLYLDFINLFLKLLRLFGKKK